MCNFVKLLSIFVFFIFCFLLLQGSASAFTCCCGGDTCAQCVSNGVNDSNFGDNALCQVNCFASGGIGGQGGKACDTNSVFPQTCSGETSGYCSSTDFCTVPDYTYASNTYECNYSCCRPIQCSDLTDLNGACSISFNACPNGKTETYADNAATSTCNSGLCCTTEQNCNQTISYGTCNSDGLAANTCGFPGGNQTQMYTQYVHPLCGQGNSSGTGYTCTPSDACFHASSGGNVACNPNTFVNNCNAGAGYSCINQNACVTTINVNVTTDYNHSGTKDGNDAGKQSVTVGDGSNNLQTDSNGSVVFGAKTTGNYTITETVPGNFQAVNNSSQGVSLTNNSGNA